MSESFSFYVKHLLNHNKVTKMYCWKYSKFFLNPNHCKFQIFIEPTEPTNLLKILSMKDLTFGLYFYPNLNLSSKLEIKMLIKRRYG